MACSPSTCATVRPGTRPSGPGDFPLLTPCETALGASWDPGLLRRVGELVGDEARRRGVHAIFAPNVNLPRSPLGGRGFEQYAEDPWLSGTLAVAWIHGVQSRRVAAVIKHLAANDSETERQIMNALVDERVLREVYLLPFELAVEAGVWGVMSAYNRVNGAYCGEHPFLLQQVLKREWQFDGFVISDASGTRSTVAAALAGLDLELPGAGAAQYFGQPLADAVRAGEVPEHVLDEAVERLLRLAHRVGRLGDGHGDAPAPEPVADPRGLLREAAAAGFVLLQNRDATLPLALGEGQTLAVIGPNAAEPCFQGGAFSQLPLPADTETPLDALRARFPNLEVVHERGARSPRQVPLLREVPFTPGLTVEFFLEDTPDDAPLAQEVRTSGSMVWMRMPGHRRARPPRPRQGIRNHDARGERHARLHDRQLGRLRAQAGRRDDRLTDRAAAAQRHGHADPARAALRRAGSRSWRAAARGHRADLPARQGAQPALRLPTARAAGPAGTRRRGRQRTRMPWCWSSARARTRRSRAPIAPPRAWPPRRSA